MYVPEGSAPCKEQHLLERTAFMYDGLSKGWNRLVVKPSHILKRNAARTHQLVSRSSQAIRLILRASTATRNFSHHARPCIDRLERHSDK